MTSATFDVIVVGAGGMGSATIAELARRGARVLGLEQFDLVHDRGSSHGETRVIRTAYYEHPCYVPMVKRSFQRWYDLEQWSGKKLLTECGCLNFGIPGGSMIEGVRRSAREFQLRIDELSGSEIRNRFPSFRVPDEFQGVFEYQAGFLAVEECVREQLNVARLAGAVVHARETVNDWKASGTGVEVETDRGRYSANRLVITAGPWSGIMLRGWGHSLRVMRQTLLWFDVRDPADFRRDVFPIYLADTPEGYFYGLPMINAEGHKVAQHYGAPELESPAEIDRDLRSGDDQVVRQFLSRYLPDAKGPLRKGQVCTYTLSPDRHFILDRHPEHPQVVMAAGFSGHGFKFAPVVAEIMSDLALNGQTGWPIDMFRITRFGPSPAAN